MILEDAARKDPYASKVPCVNCGELVDVQVIHRADRPKDLLYCSLGCLVSHVKRAEQRFRHDPQVGST